MPYLQSGNSPAWAFRQVVTRVGPRVLIVLVYNNTGRSIFAAIALHDSANASEFLFPNCGSAYDPFVTGMVMAVVVGIVVFLWGSGTWPDIDITGGPHLGPCSGGRPGG